MKLRFLPILCLMLTEPVYAQLTVDVTPQHVIRIVTSNTIQITFTNGPNPTVKDFVTIVSDGVVPASGKISNWQYLSGSTAAPSTPITKGVLSFTVPVAGRYQAYLFRNGSAVLNRVGDPVTFDVIYTSVDLDGPPTSVTRSKILTDQIDIVITGDKGATIVAPPGAPVTTNGTAQPGVTGTMP